jgi:Secretion system C-terminal sorting domain
MRPTALAGKWQYMGSGGTDIGFISAVLTKWNSSSNSRDTIGFGSKDLIDMEMAWINFSIPFTYNSNDNPDSCIIVLSASGANPAQNSYLYVDNLSFTNPTQSVSNLSSDMAFDLYPNPTTQNITLNLESNQTANLNISVMDALGNLCSTTLAQKGSLLNIDVSHLSSGIYFVRVQTSGRTTTQKFIKQ